MGRGLASGVVAGAAVFVGCDATGVAVTAATVAAAVAAAVDVAVARAVSDGEGDDADWFGAHAASKQSATTARIFTVTSFLRIRACG